MSVTAVVRRVWPETPSLTGVVLEVSGEIAAQYTQPGQYLALGEDTPTFIAIASAPGEARAFELLVGEGARARVDFSLGSRIPLEPPAGPGFPIALAEGKDVLLFSVGSGISPVRACVEHIRNQRGSFGRVTLFHGARGEAEQAYASYDAAWARDGIDVRRFSERPWVQERFLAAPVALDDAYAFVCGMKEMVEGVTRSLEDAGLPSDRIKLNF